jgi:homoserine dehydrogenase
MLAEVVVVEPRRVAAAVRPAPRTVRVGLVGLGNVGQAVARLAPDAHRLTTSGVRFRIAGALVRDVARARRCPPPARLTTNPEAFLRGHYDVVIEALGAIEPARTIVSRLLGRGIPVVTANKALVAAHGAELAALAARRGTALRYEASALAGVPFLGALSERPYVADVSRFAAVVNGTSNFILSTIDANRCAFDAALAQAQSLGLSEPDPSRDLDGLDAADKFALLASIFGWGSYAHADVEVRGIRDLGAADLAAARELGGTIKPVVWAARSDAGLEAFVGPAFVGLGHPLASLAGTLSGIQLSGRYVSDLFFSGPGAGPDITAATILDDAIEAVSSARRFPKPTRPSVSRAALVAPVTEWFVRVRFPGVVPDATAACALFSGVGLSVIQSASRVEGPHWLRIAATSAGDLERAVATLSHTHRIDCHAIRSLS